LLFSIEREAASNQKNLMGLQCPGKYINLSNMIDQRRWPKALAATGQSYRNA
jgi:hypothetical protein